MRFWPYVGAALVGTLLGMVFLEAVPRDTLPGTTHAESVCLRPGAGVKAALGFVSGLVFGASNVGVPVIAYLDTLGLYGGSALALSVVAIVPGLLGL